MTTPDDNLRHAVLNWTGGLLFTGGKVGGPTYTIDGDGEVAPSPVVSLLLAAGACAASDVVLILQKGKVELTALRVEVTGRRNADYPRRYNALTLTFHLKGTGLTEVNARRAVDLSVEKYCSVLLSLNPDIPVETKIVID